MVIFDIHTNLININERCLIGYINCIHKSKEKKQRNSRILLYCYIQWYGVKYELCIRYLIVIIGFLKCKLE